MTPNSLVLKKRFSWWLKITQLKSTRFNCFCIQLQKNLTLESLFFYLKWVIKTRLVASSWYVWLKLQPRSSQGSKWASSGHSDQGGRQANCGSPVSSQSPVSPPSSAADHQLRTHSPIPQLMITLSLLPSLPNSLFYCSPQLQQAFPGNPLYINLRTIYPQKPVLQKALEGKLQPEEPNHT